MKLYSFDVFDTLITREVATPEGIFALLQARLQDSGYIDINEYVRKNFYALRVGAEQVARSTYCVCGVEDVTLEQIYDVLVQEHHISEAQALRLQMLEEETEIAHCVGIRENIDRVKALLSKEQRVILISDMYLSGEVIRKMLIKADPVFSKLTIYVSSDEEKKNKRFGKLFFIVKEKEQVEFSEWVHVGDNEYSDVLVPEEMGITCERYWPEELLEAEQEYLKNNLMRADVQLAIGCARMARIEGPKTVAYRMGCSLGGNILYPYVRWLLEDSTAQGIQRLYFIARDGYVLKELADVLIGQNGYPIETYYIYGSRIAWRIPKEENLQQEIWDIYERSFQDRIMGLQDLADFFQISDDELKVYISAGMLENNKVWSISDVKFIIKNLMFHKKFMQLLQKKYKEKRQLLTIYLQQEVDTSNEKFAFVDLAGSGFTQECLARVMRKYYGGAIHNYFFRRDFVGAGEGTSHVFYPIHVPYFVLLEMMCRAPHGQTIGYQLRENGKVEPVFSEVDGKAIIDHQVPEFIAGVKAFGKRYNNAQGMEKNIGNIIQIIPFYLNYIYNMPDDIVLNYFGDMPNMLTGRERVLSLFAPELTARDIKRLYWYREDEPIEYFYRGSDLPYSLRRCSPMQKQKIAWYQDHRDSWYGKLDRKCYRMLWGKEVHLRMTNFYDCIGKRIVIYGAGRRGQHFYAQLMEQKKALGPKFCTEIVLWIDQNYLDYQKQGLPISEPENITTANYDQVIIALKSQEAAEQVIDFLVEKGALEEKILWLT